MNCLVGRLILSRNQEFVACENILFSSLFVAVDISRRGTSATQRQKFYTDDANQCLHNKSSSHGVPNINLSNFMCLPIKCHVHLPTRSSKTHILLLEKTIFHIYIPHIYLPLIGHKQIVVFFINDNNNNNKIHAGSGNTMKSV